MGTEACPATCLRATHKHLVPEWDYAANGDLTPDNVTHGSQKKVSWLCLTGKGHPSYRKEIRTRANSASGCEMERQEMVKAKKLETQRATRANLRRLAKNAEPSKPTELQQDGDLFDL
jgi:hypothetical protein